MDEKRCMAEGMQEESEKRGGRVKNWKGGLQRRRLDKRIGNDRQVEKKKG